MDKIVIYLPPRAKELILFSKACVPSLVKISVALLNISQHCLLYFYCFTNNCIEWVPYEQDSGVVDLFVVVVLHLVLPGHVGPLLCGVAVCLHCDHYSTVGRHSFTIESLLPKTDIIVHTPSIVTW